MRTVLQRVQRAHVDVAGHPRQAIGPGLLIFVGVAPEDTEADIAWLVRKITQTRIFDAAQDQNASLLDIGGEALVIVESS